MSIDGATKLGDPQVFFVLYRSIEEALENEEHLNAFGMKYVRFKCYPDSSLLTSINESCGPMMNQDPIQIPFAEDEFEKFLYAIALMEQGRDLDMFEPHELCTILKLADYFECPNLMQRVFSQINEHLIGKTPSEICEIFDIRFDFNQSQKNQMEQEGLWCFNASP